MKKFSYLISLLAVLMIFSVGCFQQGISSTDTRIHQNNLSSNPIKGKESLGDSNLNLDKSLSILATTDHSMAVDHMGNLWMWGTIIKDGQSINQLNPIKISDVSKVKALAGTRTYTLILKQDGTVWGRGNNQGGQLGDGTFISRTKPVQAIGLENIQVIDAFSASAIALKQDGTVWTWGDNTNGQLGVDRDNGEVPAQVPGLQDIIAVAASDLGSLALQEDGTVWAWGYGPQLDLHVEGVGQDIPAKVEGINDVVDISARGGDILALKKDGTVWNWGSGGPPNMVEKLTNISAIKQGSTWSYAIDQDGTVWNWSGDEEPKKVPGLSNIVSISGGMEYTIAVDADGNLWSWGDNTYGQLGDGTTVSRDTPVQISLEEGTSIKISYTDAAIYTVKEDGKQLSFSAEFPSSWKDKYLVKQQEGWVGIYHNTNHEEAAMILSFHAISLKEWEEYVELDPGFPWWSKLGEVNGMVIVSNEITDQPYSNGTSEETEEVMRMLEHIDEVRISNVKDH